MKLSVLRDPVHGDVHLTEEELSLVDTPEFQRLRGVRQLGTTYLVYPGATHTRFEHSIGSVHMAARMMESIERNRQIQPDGLSGVPPEGARTIRFATLLHDVTHLPFGHDIEDQIGLFARHDTPARLERALTDGALGRRLAELGARDDVLGVLGAGKNARTVPVAWQQIVSDTICSDTFDYLKRDAWYTGLQLGYDPRIISAFKVDRATGNLFVDVEKRGLVREDVLSEIVRMLEARYYFSERVYFHHAKISAEALVAKCVELAIATEAAREEDFRALTDETMVGLLERLDYRDAEIGARARRFLERFRSRRLLKRCAVFPRYANRDSQRALLDRFFAPGRHEARLGAERRIEAAAREALSRDVDVLLYCPAREMQLKEARIHVLFPGEERVRPLSDFADRIPRLRDLEESYRNLWKFYVFSSEEDPRAIATLAEIIAREIPDAVNVYRAG